MVVGGALGVLFGGTLLLAGCQSAAAGRSLGTERDASMALSGSAPAALLPGGVAVSCAPGQQTLVRQAVVNGQAVARVECVGVQTAAATGDMAGVYGQAAPVASAPAVYRAATYADEVVYQRPAPRRAVRKSGRSWQKSAVIIGSSAGIGAGVGGIVGGKKGALIGAAIGGGGAAIWDQVTRRKQ
jgi:hypothetical protein